MEILGDKGAWDALVDESTQGALFHRWDFLQLMARHSGFRLMPYGIYKDGALACVFPIFFKANKGIRMVCSPPPGLSVPYLGPVMASFLSSLGQDEKEAFMRDTLGAVEAELVKLSPHYVSLQTVPHFDDIRPFQWHGFGTEVNYDYIIDLDRPIEKIWASLDKDVKKVINDLGQVPIEAMRSYDAKAFFSLLSVRISDKKQTFSTPNSDFYDDVLKTFPDNMKLHFYYHKGEFICAKIEYMYKDKYMAWKGFATGKFNEYMMWDRIKWANSNGYRVFENPDADTRRLAQYKSKFNPSLEVSYTLSRRNIIGRVSEWAYVNVYCEGLRRARSLGH
ncbi:MAG TPA: GNAT family N-acetyltransferase [Methanocellaceae archaeon]|jgi:hypothetical protein